LHPLHYSSDPLLCNCWLFEELYSLPFLISHASILRLVHLLSISWLGVLVISRFSLHLISIF
jgi:hypothetical protein